MVLELMGARILAPYLGTSIIVWTSLLGVVMVSLSMGYYLGGKVADRWADYKILALLLLMAGLFTSMAAILKSTLLFYIQSGIADIKWASLIGASMLFSPATLFLGAISPYVVKLYFNDSNRVGATVGNLYAISTVGSIVGTYFTGFFLISKLGSTNILFSLAALLVFMSLVVYPIKVVARCFLVLLFSTLTILNTNLNKQFAALGFIDVDTKYNRVWIQDSIDQISKRPLRTLSTGAHYVQSAMFLDGNDLAVEYTDFFKVAEYFHKDIKKALMVGGGAYSFPKDFLTRNTNSEMDVAEIDSGLTELAKEYFSLEISPRLSVFHQDGRVFLNGTKNRYDAIFIDAFASSIPFHLTTQEFVAKVFDRLNDDGVVVMNIVASVEGEKGRFVRAEYGTYRLFSDFVYLFPVQSPTDGYKVQNVLLVAIKKNVRASSDVSATSTACSVAAEFCEDGSGVIHIGDKFQKYLNHLWVGGIKNDVPVLTDDFAPVDQYLANII